jgi:hypothetical protein
MERIAGTKVGMPEARIRPLDGGKPVRLTGRLMRPGSSVGVHCCELRIAATAKQGFTAFYGSDRTSNQT